MRCMRARTREGALDGEPDAGAMHEDVEDLVEGSHAVDGQVRAVVACNAREPQCRASRHERTHAWHDCERAHRALQLSALRGRNTVPVPLPQVFFHKVKVPAQIQQVLLHQVTLTVPASQPAHA
jgi:hypothetical protein